MKKFLIWLIALALMGLLAACADNTTTESPSVPASQPPVQEAVISTASEPPSVAAESAGPESAPDPLAADTTGMTTALVMSYNIYYLDVEHRVQPISELLLSHSPDVMGFVETSAPWVQPIKDFSENNGYSYYGYGRHGAGFDDDEITSNEQFALILWKTDKYDLLDSGRFWASSTPEVQRSSTWLDGTTSDFPRCINWVKLRDTQTGGEAVFVSCHLAPYANNATVRNHSLKLIAEKMSGFVDAGIPVMLMGDFNFQLDEPAYDLLTNRLGYSDVRFIAPQTTMSGTYNDWGGKSPESYSFLDYFFVTPGVIAEFFEVVDCRVINGEFLSDHFPILTRIFF